ncbi:MAG: CBS domain-containing protein [Candidatus Limnocylindria bacterium]
MKVRDIMTRDPSTLAPTATLGEAATIMKQEDCGSVPVVEAGRLIGIVTDRDIVVRVVAAGKDPKTELVSEAMTADPVTVEPDASVDEAQRVMADRQVRRLPVVEDGKLVGLVVIGQVARGDDARDVGETLKDVSEKGSGRSSHGRG